MRLLLILFLTIPLSLYSEFGFKIGISNSKIMYDTQGIKKSDLTGIRTGLFYKFNLGNSRVSIQPEVYYVEKGVNLSRDLVGEGSVDVEIMRKYIEIPLIVRFNLLQRKYLHFDVYFGFYYAFNLSAKQKLMYLNETFEQEDNQTKKHDTGYTTGGIVSFSAGKGELLFEFRFTTGVMDTRKNSYTGAGGALKNSTFSLMAGYSF